MSGELHCLVKAVDMEESMQKDAISFAQMAIEDSDIERDIAKTLKKAFDSKYGPNWHCVVGRSYGSYVGHESRHYIYFCVGQFSILLFKAG